MHIQATSSLSIRWYCPRATTSILPPPPPFALITVGVLRLGRTHAWAVYNTQLQSPQRPGELTISSTGAS